MSIHKKGKLSNIFPLWIFWSRAHVAVIEVCVLKIVQPFYFTNKKQADWLARLICRVYAPLPLCIGKDLFSSSWMVMLGAP